MVIRPSQLIVPLPNRLLVSAFENLWEFDPLLHTRLKPFQKQIIFLETPWLSLDCRVHNDIPMFFDSFPSSENFGGIGILLIKLFADQTPVIGPMSTVDDKEVT